MRLYVESEGRTEGPVSPEELVRMIREALLDEDDEIWLESTTRTVPVHRLLNGRAHSEAELEGVLAALREELAPTTPVGPRPRPQVFSGGELLLPGFAVAAAALVGGVAALFWLGLSLFNTFLFL
jgi:hypothetical protein